MKSGPETDAIIARRVWRSIVVVDTVTGCFHMIAEGDRRNVPIPFFSTKLEDAYRIVRFFQSKGWAARVKTIPERGTSSVCFTMNDNRTYRYSEEASLPLAICSAALDALDGKNVVS